MKTGIIKKSVIWLCSDKFKDLGDLVMGYPRAGSYIDKRIISDEFLYKEMAVVPYYDPVTKRDYLRWIGYRNLKLITNPANRYPKVDER